MTKPAVKKDATTGQFLPGNIGGGRKKGARNRLHADFVVALQEHFSEMGQAAIDIVFRERPNEYLKIIASVLPKEFILEDGRLESMGDDELEHHLERIAEVRRLQFSNGQGRSDPVGGKKPTPD